jgi:ABC-type uncharacterized transport system involved in gliding motility auxiliary subunit
MVMDTERWIGVIIGDSFRQWREDFSFLGRSLEDSGFRVRQISAGDEIPENLPGLFVFGGVEELDPWALYRIDRYIQQGGKVLFAVKGVYVDTVYGSVEARHLEDQGLLAMIASYGAVIRPELTLDRNALTLQYQTRSPSGGLQYRIVRYPLWIGVLADNGNSQHPVSSGFSGLDLYWSSPLELYPSEGIEAVTLFTSTPQAWSMRENLFTSPEVMYMLEMEAAHTRGTKILGASLSGTFPSFFRGFEKPVREGSDEELPDLPDYTNPSRVIVIGETDFATNMINATQARHNLDFLLRAADWLVSDDDIISIRNRQPQIGRLDKIHDSADRKSAVRFIQVLNVGVIPLLVIAAGIFLAWRRKQRSLFSQEISVKEDSNDV